jgi:hypothetical protein
MTWFIIAGLLVIIFYSAYVDKKKIAKNNEELQSEGYDFEKFIETGKYIAGHPKIDKSCNITAILPKADWLLIFEYPSGKITNKPNHIGGIQFKNIDKILAEDSSTMERRVTLGRVVMLGIFAFAFKKNKKNEIAYLTIKWSEGKFEHETYFEFVGKDAIQKANTARNKIIRVLEL